MWGHGDIGMQGLRDSGMWGTKGSGDMEMLGCRDIGHRDVGDKPI